MGQDNARADDLAVATCCRPNVGGLGRISVRLLDTQVTKTGARLRATQVANDPNTLPNEGIESKQICCCDRAHGEDSGIVSLPLLE